MKNYSKNQMWKFRFWRIPFQFYISYRIYLFGLIPTLKG
jgi:hypothetical protein